MPLYVLGTNGNLWLEAPGWQTTGRTLIDSNVQAFTPAPEPATCTWRGPTIISGWSPRLAAARAHLDRRQRPDLHPLASGYLYVEGTDH